MTKIFSEFRAAVTFLWFFLLVVAKERTTLKQAKEKNNKKAGREVPAG
jgi:hypothetical protein